MFRNQSTYGAQHTLLPLLSLFTSFGTLLCCALPALLVAIGAGVTLAGLVSTIPWLVALSKYKVWTFAVSGVLIIVAGIAIWGSRNMPCPTDPEKARSCIRLRKINVLVYALSVILWGIGFFFAFIAEKIFF